MALDSRLASLLTAIGADIKALFGGTPINSQTGTTYTTVLADQTQWIAFANAGAMTLTIPPNSSVAYPVATELTGCNEGPGTLTLVQGSGVTLNSRYGLIVKPGGVWSAKKTATNTWRVFGDLSLT